MKKTFLLIVLFFITSLAYTKENRVKIDLELSPFFGGEIVEFYDGNDDSARKIIEEIDDSRYILSIFVAKTVLTEGTYTISIYDDKTLTRQYKLNNPFDLYSLEKDKYYKTNVYNIILELFTQFLLMY